MPTASLYYPNGGLPPYQPDPVNAPNDWTVDVWTRQPTVIRDIVADDVRNHTISDYVFRTAVAPSGSVQFNETELGLLGVDPDSNRQPGEVRPGAEFPIVGPRDTSMTIRSALKYGAKFYITYEQRDRDIRDVVNQGITDTVNQLILNSDARAVAAFNAKVPTMNRSAVWSSNSNAAVQDIMAAVSGITRTQLNYRPDTVIINPALSLTLLQNTNLWNLLPRENTQQNPVLSGKLSGLLGLNWIESPVAPLHDVIVCQRQAVGFVAVERPITTDIIDLKSTQEFEVITSHRDLAVVNSPKAAMIIKGVDQ